MPTQWNHELHNIVGCDHDSQQARRLDRFLDAYRRFMLGETTDLPVAPLGCHQPLPDLKITVTPLPPRFTRQRYDAKTGQHLGEEVVVTEQMREDAAKEPRGETITYGNATTPFPPAPLPPFDATRSRLSPKPTRDLRPFSEAPPPVDLPAVEVTAKRFDLLTSIRRSWRQFGKKEAS